MKRMMAAAILAAALAAPGLAQTGDFVLGGNMLIGSCEGAIVDGVGTYRIAWSTNNPATGSFYLAPGYTTDLRVRFVEGAAVFGKWFYCRDPEDGSKGPLVRIVKDGTVVMEGRAEMYLAAPDERWIGPSGSVTWSNGSDGSFGISALGLSASCSFAIIAPAPASAAIPLDVADLDRDGDVDISDFGRFQGCFAKRVAPGCERADCDGDGAVDLADFGRFQNCFNGANRRPRC